VRIFLLVSRGWGWRFEASGAVRSLVFVITPEGFSVNAFLCVDAVDIDITGTYGGSTLELISDT
jgi:hypothetical protein